MGQRRPGLLRGARTGPGSAGDGSTHGRQCGGAPARRWLPCQGRGPLADGAGLTLDNDPDLTEGSATSIVTQELGVRATGARRVAGSVGNATFVVRVASGGDVVLKVGSRDLLTAETWACGRVRDAGIPGPEVVTHRLDTDAVDTAFIIMRVLPGEPTRDLDVWRQAGRSFRAVHDIRLPGYGALAVRPDEVRGRHGSWHDALDSVLARIPDLVTAGVLTRDLGGHLDQAIRSSGIMTYREPGVLLHRDLKPQHVFADRARLAGIIDWGDVGVGDPMLDIARVSMAGQEILSAFLDGYGLSLTPELGDNIRAYRLLWNLAALAFEFSAGGDWFDFYRRNIQADLGARG
ncbi:hypothetical protein C6361_00905 [Plantactinospora sp. BC1]|nr:hypothetical protein C6361_00905 [Plantactinospora sp. BC1]